MGAVSAAAPLLEARDLSVSFGSGRLRITALEAFSFRLGEGEALGLVGESGSGKSTVLRAVMGLIPAAGGRISLSGRPVATAAAAGR